MKKNKTRILAVLMALMLSLGMVPALAEAPVTVPNLATLLESVGTMQYDVELNVNPGAVAMIMGLSGQAPDEATMGMVNTLVSAVNKLKFNVLAGKEAISAVIGSDTAPLMELQAAMNPETFENHITTSMLPGTAISIDPAMIQKYMGQAAGLKMDPKKTMEIVQQHMAAIGGLLNEFAAGFTPEEGSFTVEGYGTFTKRTQVTLTTHMLADLLQKMADIYNGAPVHKETMEKILSATNSLQEGAGTAQEIPDIGKQLDEAAKKGKEEPDMPVLTGFVYEGENATYIDGMTPPEAGSQMKLDLLFSKQGGLNQTKIKVIVKSPSYGAEAAAQAAPDWAAIEKDILGGQNYSDALVNVAINNTGELPQMSTEVTADVVAGGMNIGLKVNSNSRLDTLESKFDFSVSLMSPEPMLTLSVSSKPTEEQPAAPVLDGATPIVLKEEMGEEENSLLQASLAKAIPDLFTRIGAAVPEEAPALIQMIQELMAPKPTSAPEGTQPGAVVEPAPEVVVEPAPANP